MVSFGCGWKEEEGEFDPGLEIFAAVRMVRRWARNG